MSLGSNLKRIRETFGLSQKEFLERLGSKAQGYLSQIENGKKIPSQEKIVYISHIFDIPIECISEGIPIPEEIILKWRNKSQLAKEIAKQEIKTPHAVAVTTQPEGRQLAISSIHMAKAKEDWLTGSTTERKLIEMAVTTLYKEDAPKVLAWFANNEPNPFITIDQMISEGMNCEDFYALKKKWQSGEVDKSKIAQAIYAAFPERANKILAWFDRPQPDGPRNLLTIDKFDA